MEAVTKLPHTTARRWKHNWSPHCDRKRIGMSRESSTVRHRLTEGERHGERERERKKRREKGREREEREREREGEGGREKEREREGGMERERGRESGVKACAFTPLVS